MTNYSVHLQRVGRHTQMLWLTSLALVLTAVSYASSDSATDISNLIGKARSFDSMYCGAEKEDRDKAITFYEAALKGRPDKQQTLEVLFRLAQLHGTNYQVPKGERPHYAQAMALYQRIVWEYPHDEPLAVKSLICIGDILVTDWHFAEALQWYFRALEIDADAMLAQNNTLQNDPERHGEYEQMMGKIRLIRFYQSSAVKAASYAAIHIDPSVRNALMENILTRYHGDHIRDAVKAAMAKREQVDLFPLPEHFEDMALCNEPAASITKRNLRDMPKSNVPDPVPSMWVMPGTSGSCQGILIALAGAAIVVLAAVFVMRRKIGNQLRRKSS